MSHLPKLNTATYELTLPSTGQKVKYRPFLVREYRSLLTAQQDSDNKTVLATIIELVNNCTNGKLDAAKLPLFDLEYIILQLRSKSVGEVIELLGRCNCSEDAKTPVQINIEHIKMTTVAKGSEMIKIADNVVVKMGFPTAKVLESVDEDNSEFDLISRCIQQIYFGDEIYEASNLPKAELTEFIDSLNQKQFESLIGFINNQPKLSYVLKYKCKVCGRDNEVTLEGLNDFFI